MPIKWTDEQKKAIDTRGKNLLVSAAAGSGKTAVLVERVIKRITDENNPIQIDRLLIATFTNAAANGMQIKIREALKNQLDINSTSEYLAKQLALLPRATITTVHSFCQNLIRNNFHQLGLSASFEIGDETQLSMLREQALERVLESRYENPTKDFEVLAEAFGGKRDDSSLADAVKHIYSFTQSTANPVKWLNDAKNKFKESGFNEWSRYILSSLKDEVYGMIHAYNRAIDVINTSYGIDKYCNTFNLEKESLYILLEKCSIDWDEARGFIQSMTFSRLPPKSKDADDSSASYVQEIRNGVKKQISKMNGIFYASGAEIISDNIILSGIIGELCNMVLAFSAEYQRLKHGKNLVDFNDLEHYTLKLLGDPETSQIMKDRYDEVLVDEYQDTNGVQEAIFQTVSRENNLFMVGDVKQSIYGFRNAQPGIFTSKAKKYVENCGLGMQISLSHNFRSTGGIIYFVNEVFRRLMSEDIGGVDYEKGHSLVCGRNACFENKNAVELHIIDKKLEENDELTDEDLLTDEITREAMFVARRITQLVEVEKPEITVNDETGETRKIEYGDIAVLTRKNKGVSGIYAENFARAGVPFYCEDETSDYIISSEIATILSFLQIIDNPVQDIPLLTVLRSPIFLFSDEELAHIRCKDDNSFYDAVCASDSEKCKSFIKTLSYYRDMASHESIEFVIRSILSDTGYLSFTGSLPNGETRVANLRLLCERAGRFEANEYKSIFDFINYINSMTEYSQSYSAAKTVGENDNAVRMMSIHKSKGLEFPVVFFARCGERFNKSDLSASIQYDIELGIGCDFIDIERGIKYPSVSKLAIAQKKLYSLLSEEMRIMYVALTRPMDMLFIVGSCVNVHDKISKWENSDVSPYTIFQQNTYLDWLGMSLNNKIRTFAKIHSANDIIMQGRSAQGKSQGVCETENNGYYSDEIAQRLEYKYKYSAAKYIPSKLPVSRAADIASYSVKLKKPEFMQKRDLLSAAVRGTIIHFVMQNIDIYKTENYNEIKLQLDEMVNKGMLDKRFVDVVSIKALEGFFQSDTGKRMKASSDVQREVKFFVDVPAHEIFDDVDKSVANETILLQGVVDCLFEEDGKLVLIDYKTGAADKPEYKKQLEFYAKGISKTLGKNVKDTILYPLT